MSPALLAKMVFTAVFVAPLCLYLWWQAGPYVWALLVNRSKDLPLIAVYFEGIASPTGSGSEIVKIERAGTAWRGANPLSINDPRAYTKLNNFTARIYKVTILKPDGAVEVRQAGVVVRTFLGQGGVVEYHNGLERRPISG